MIDKLIYRRRVGLFNQSYMPTHRTRNPHPRYHSPHNSTLSHIPILWYYTVILHLSTLMLLILASSDLETCPPTSNSSFSSDSNNSKVPYLFSALVFLLTIVMDWVTVLHGPPNAKRSCFLYFCVQHLRYKFPKKSCTPYKIFRKYVLWLASYNLLLLTFCNMSLLNPGPTNSISVLYQNVRGFIPFGELGNKHPILHDSKIAELHSHVYKAEPDIIILNETWLKPCIHDNELFSPIKFSDAIDLPVPIHLIPPIQRSIDQMEAVSSLQLKVISTWCRNR
jgi:hypothetical protein